MAQALVDVPELVTVSATEGRHTAVLEVRTAPTDVGKVIGKEGANRRRPADHLERCGR